MNIKHRMILLLTGCFWMFSIQAQTVRAISVAQGKSYTDHISLKPDSKDMDLMVKFVFKEDANTLTVTLISYRSLFVFWDKVHFKPLIKGRRTYRQVSHHEACQGLYSPTEEGVLLPALDRL